MSSSSAAKADLPNLTFRDQVTREDLKRVREVVESTGVFYAHEVDVAVELVDERLSKGAASGYHFVFAEADGQVLGYVCYGLIACTISSFDLYWIAVQQTQQGRGIGQALLRRAEQLIHQQGGGRIYIETSNRPQYLPTRSFYERSGYIQEATLADFYGPSDDKVIYVKRLMNG